MRDLNAHAAVLVAGDPMMPDWLYRILRRFSPSLRAQEYRLARTDALVAASRRTRHNAERVQLLLHSYTRAGRRLDDLRSHR